MTWNNTPLLFYHVRSAGLALLDSLISYKTETKPTGVQGLLRSTPGLLARLNSLDLQTQAFRNTSPYLFSLLHTKGRGLRNRLCTRGNRTFRIVPELWNPETISLHKVTLEYWHPSEVKSQAWGRVSSIGKDSVEKALMSSYIISRKPVWPERWAGYEARLTVGACHVARVHC